MIRVLIAEDSAVARGFLTCLLTQDPALQVVGAAEDGEEAVALAERLRPDLVLMDVHMPRLDGYEATRQIMERVPTPIVMCSASVSKEEVAITFKSLEAGALSVVAKPAGLDQPDHAETARRLVDTVKLMAEMRVVRRWPEGTRPGAGPAARAPQTPTPRRDGKIRLIVIGASVGGPQALQVILRGLPSPLGAPILLVQHICPGFVQGFGEWLAERTGVPVAVAADGEAVRPGRVHLAPDGAQMGVGADGRITLLPGQVEGGFCPSISYTFRQAEEACGATALGILLSGMGRDGAAGLLRLRAAGGMTVVQDEATSVVYGMPGEAVRLGAAERVLPPQRIADLIRSLET